MTDAELLRSISDVLDFFLHPLNFLIFFVLYWFLATIFRPRQEKKHPNDPPGGSGGGFTPDGGPSGCGDNGGF
jgi:hypothetical protein